MNKISSTISFLKSVVLNPVMKVKSAANAAAGLLAAATGSLHARAPRSYYHVECIDAAGNLKWVEDISNQVCTAGINDLLTNYFKGSSYTAAWYVGLVDGGSTPTYAAGDTSASHSGWTENVSYSNANRPTLTLGSASAGSINNSGSVAAFNINATATIAGMFVITVNTKSGTTGVLYGEANFSAGNRSVLSGDTLNVTVTISAS